MGFERKRLVHKMRKSLADVLPPEMAYKWEDRMRNSSLKEKDWKPVNDLIAYGVDGENLHVHVHENLTRDRFGVSRHIMEGMRLLAARLRTEPELSGIRWIEGHSWLVYKYPEIFERFGFTISQRDEINRTALAAIEKAAFIRQFGGKDKHDPQSDQE